MFLIVLLIRMFTRIRLFTMVLFVDKNRYKWGHLNTWLYLSYFLSFLQLQFLQIIRIELKYTELSKHLILNQFTQNTKCSQIKCPQGNKNRLKWYDLFSGMSVNGGSPALTSLGMTNMGTLGNGLSGNSVDALSQAYSGIQQYSGE